MTARAGQEPWPAREQHMRLRMLSRGDAGAYLRMRCDPVMMSGLGGPLPRAGVGDKVSVMSGRLRRAARDSR